MPKDKTRKKTVTRQSANLRPHSRRWHREGGWICNKCGGHNWIGKNFCRIDLDGKGKRCQGRKERSRQILPTRQPLNSVKAEKGSQEEPELRLEDELPRDEEGVAYEPHDNATPKTAVEMENPRADSAETVLDTTRLALDLAEDEERKTQAVEYLKWKLDKSLEKERLLEGYLAHQYLATNAYRELQDRELTADEVLWLLQKETSENAGNN